jgi:hypothetical protein
MNLEEEFQKVQAKQAAGELSEEEAEDLINIIATRRQYNKRNRP